MNIRDVEAFKKPRTSPPRLQISAVITALCLLLTTPFLFAGTQRLVIETSSGLSVIDARDLSAQSLYLIYHPDPAVATTALSANVFFDPSKITVTLVDEEEQSQSVKPLFAPNFFDLSYFDDEQDLDNNTETTQILRLVWLAFTGNFDAADQAGNPVSYPLSLARLEVTEVNDAFLETGTTLISVAPDGNNLPPSHSEFSSELQTEFTINLTGEQLRSRSQRLYLETESGARSTDSLDFTENRLILSYIPDPAEATSTVSANIFYNSEKISLTPRDETQSTNGTDPAPNQTLSPLYKENFLGWGTVIDSSNLDQDSSTDRILVMTWLSISSGFDEGQSYPLALATINIEANQESALSESGTTLWTAPDQFNLPPSHNDFSPTSFVPFVIHPRESTSSPAYQSLSLKTSEGNSGLQTSLLNDQEVILFYTPQPAQPTNQLSAQVFFNRSKIAIVPQDNDPETDDLELLFSIGFQGASISDDLQDSDLDPTTDAILTLTWFTPTDTFDTDSDYPLALAKLSITGTSNAFPESGSTQLKVRADPENVPASHPDSPEKGLTTFELIFTGQPKPSDTGETDGGADDGIDGSTDGGTDGGTDGSTDGGTDGETHGSTDDGETDGGTDDSGSSGGGPAQGPALILPATTVSLEANSSLGASLSDLQDFFDQVTAADAAGNDLTSSIIITAPDSLALGETIINISVADSDGATIQQNVSVRVVDTTPPEIVLTNTEFEASGITGTAVSEATILAAISAEDTVDPNPEVSILFYLPDFFPLGTSPLAVSAADQAGNTVLFVVSIIVTDRTPPVISALPLVVEATSASGTAVSSDQIFSSVTATDLVDSDVALRLIAQLPVNFPLGTTSVDLIAEDDAGNETSFELEVRVVDTQPPTLTTPDDLFLALEDDAAIAMGDPSILRWLAQVSAVDLVDGEVAVSHDLIANLGPGITEVSFTATDAAQNVSQVMLRIVVKQPPVMTQVEDLVVVASQSDLMTGEFPPIAALIAAVKAQDSAGSPLTVSVSLTEPIQFGENIITFSAIDEDGLSTTQTIRVTVLTPSESRDTDGDGLDDAFEAIFGLDPNNPNDGEQDADLDGRTNLEEYLGGFDPQKDDVAPQIASLIDLTVPATGRLTSISLEAPEASDEKDGALLALASDIGPFEPGRHDILWRAEDAAGNAAESIQIIKVEPIVSTARFLRGSEGERIELTLNLNGPAQDYPIRVPFSVTGSATLNDDYTLSENFVEFINLGTRATTATIDISLLKDSDAAETDETIEITFENPDRGAHWATEQTVEILIVEAPALPSLNFSITQGESQGQIVARDGGEITVDLIVSDPNGSHFVDWSQTNSELLEVATFMDKSMIIAPAALAPSIYRVGIEISDSELTLPSHAYIDLHVRSDFVSTDSDGDGLADSLDPSAPLNAIVAHAESSNFWLESDLGTKLTLGSAALAARANAAALTAAELEAAFNATGDIRPTDSEFDYPQGFFDFEIQQISVPGQTVNVVIPLRDNLPANATYRKLTRFDGFAEFVVDTKNKLSSAIGGNGACPTPGSILYQPGLALGHGCVQLSIEDGGPNDADRSVNGLVKDPGGIAISHSGNSDGGTGPTDPSDRDGDGVADETDAFPDNASEWRDTDLDGTGDNADADDDNDLFSDAQEQIDQTDPLDPLSCASCFTLDIDEDGQAEPLTDGLLLLRYLFGFEGVSLVKDATNPNGVRTTALSISNYLDQANLKLDVDDSGDVQPLSDGILIVRFLFGFVDAALIKDAIGPDAKRRSAADISTYITRVRPIPKPSP